MNKKVNVAVKQLSSGLSFEEFEYEFSTSFVCANMGEYAALDFEKLYNEYLNK